MADAVLWFLTIQLLGVAALPWVFRLFRFLPDRGVTLAKPASVLVISYLVWVSGLARLLPNTTLTIWIIVLCIIVASMWLAGRQWEELREFLRQRWQLILAGELVFLLMFVAWALVVSGSPGITHTEKPMDFMLLNAAHQARYFPAEDAWLSGHSISYYYFGHIIVATLSKMSGVVTSVGYNLGVATVPALAGAVAFGLLYNLVRLAGGGMRWALGLGASAPAVILLAGNLAGALEFVRIRGWGGPGFWDWASIQGMAAQAAEGGVFPGEFWWWFRSTRIINTTSSDGATLDYTITEFPAFSFLLGDLHAHVIAIPFLLLAVAAALNVYCSGDRLELTWLRRNPAQAVSVALAGGALAFLNFWDFATFMALFAAALTLKGCRDYPGSLLHAVNGAASVFLPLFLLAIVMFAPVYFSFSGQTDGVLPLREVATNPFHLFIVLGLFILPCLALLAQKLGGIRRPQGPDAPVAVVALVIAAIPFGIWMATAFLFTMVADGAGAALDDLGRRMTLALPGAIVVGLAAYVAAARARRNGPESPFPDGKGRDFATSFVLLLLALGFFLVMVADLFHIVDAFSGPWRRMNTVFKVYYQAWLLLGIAGAFAVYALWSAGVKPRTTQRARQRSKGDEKEISAASVVKTAGKWGGAGFLAFLLAASFYYTLGAALDRSGTPYEGRTLDGLAYLKLEDPAEHAAIAWLRDDAPPGRIVEAVGDDYSRFSNVSASTGLPTVLGWVGHELQWRGSSEPFAGRAEDVATIYTSQDPGEVRRLLEKYQVRYVYLGKREQEKYGVSSLENFKDFLKSAFQQDNVVVYEFSTIAEP